MKIEIKSHKNGVIVVLNGVVFETGNAEVFSKTANALISKDNKFFALDFSASSLPDSRFLSRMVEIYNENKKIGVPLYLICGGNDDVLELFKISYFDQIISIFKTEDEISS